MQFEHGMTIWSELPICKWVNLFKHRGGNNLNPAV